MVEASTGTTARKNDMEAHSAELTETFADVSHASDLLGYQPKISAHDGVKSFVDWFRWYNDQGMFRPFPHADFYFPGGPADKIFKQRQDF